MRKLFMLAAAATLMLSGSASAQDKAQAVEKSAILPSAGWDTTTGAASTVQRHGLSVEVRSDCAPISNAPKAGN